MTISHTIGPFSRFFQIAVGHAFFADTICRGLEWVPTAATWQTLDNMGMLFRAIEGGMAVYYDTRLEQVMALAALQTEADASGLIFKAYAKDSFFKLYTAYPESGNACLFLDTDHTAKDKSGAIRLHPKPLVSDQQMVPLDNLLDDGVLTRRDLGTPPVLVVCIDAAGNAASPMDSKGNINEKRYRIHFDNRHTYWKYYVLGSLATKDVFVADPDRQWTFDQAAADPVTGDRPAAAFISSSPIPLCEVPNARFQLKLTAGKRDKIMIQRLPVARLDRMHRDTSQFGEAMISEIFIHS